MEMTLKYFGDDFESHSKCKTGFNSDRSQMWAVFFSSWANDKWNLICRELTALKEFHPKLIEHVMFNQFLFERWILNQSNLIVSRLWPHDPEPNYWGEHTLVICCVSQLAQPSAGFKRGRPTSNPQIQWWPRSIFKAKATSARRVWMFLKLFFAQWNWMNKNQVQFEARFFWSPKVHGLHCKGFLTELFEASSNFPHQSTIAIATVQVKSP